MLRDVYHTVEQIRAALRSPSTASPLHLYTAESRRTEHASEYDYGHRPEPNRNIADLNVELYSLFMAVLKSKTTLERGGDQIIPQAVGIRPTHRQIPRHSI
jgi:hypothetical protein